MNRKQIEEEMKRVTEEGRQLQEKLLIVEALKECKEKGHDAIQAELDMDFNGGTRAEFICRRCTARFVFENEGYNYPPWCWNDGPFKGKTVADVYEEEEPEEPEEPTPPIDPEHGMELQTFDEYENEPTSDGAYRVDTKKMFTTRDDNVEY